MKKCTINFKRVLTLIMALMIVVSFVPITNMSGQAYAEETSAVSPVNAYVSIVSSDTDYLKAQKLEVGYFNIKPYITGSATSFVEPASITTAHALIEAAYFYEFGEDAVLATLTNPTEAVKASVTDFLNIYIGQYGLRIGSIASNSSLVMSCVNNISGMGISTDLVSNGDNIVFYESTYPQADNLIRVDINEIKYSTVYNYYPDFKINCFAKTDNWGQVTTLTDYVITRDDNGAWDKSYAYASMTDSGKYENVEFMLSTDTNYFTVKFSKTGYQNAYVNLYYTFDALNNVVTSVSSSQKIGSTSEGSNSYSPSLNDICGASEADELHFYGQGGWDYSMLGNQFTENSPLSAAQNSGVSGYSGYCLSACIAAPTSTITDLTVKWYYGSTYSATGEGYTEINLGKLDYASSENGSASYLMQSKGTGTNILYYQYTDCSTDAAGNANQYGPYYNFQLWPGTSSAGTTYWYVAISDNASTLTSIKSQAVVKITESSSNPGSSVLGDDITVNFTLNTNGNYKGFTKAVTVPAGSTAQKVIETAFNGQTGYSLDIISASWGAYIRSVTFPYGNLAEMNDGKYSGWMYLVNNKAPNVGVGYYYVSGGDNVVLYYTKDFTQDSYAIESMMDTTVTTTEQQAADTKTVDGTTSVTPEVKVSGTQATAAVSEAKVADIVKQAKAEGTREVVITAESTSKSVNDTKVTMPASLVKQVSEETQVPVKIETAQADISLDNKTMTEIVKANGSSVSVEVKTTAPSREQAKTIGETAKVIDITIKSGSTVVSQFNGGNVTVETEVPSALYDKRIAAVYVAPSNELTALESKVKTADGKKYIEFVTPHCSTFAVVDADQAGVEFVTEEETVKNILLNVSLKVKTSYTANKNVKVTVSMDESSKEAVNELKDMGYTVKYQFYRSSKKSTGYALKKTKDTNAFTNTKGTKGMTYYYKARLAVYDKDGNLAARTALPLSGRGIRKWTK